ncbi:MAG TPA: Spy/CpxP family protein refolding chaperone [Zeimonas sp.]
MKAFPSFPVLSALALALGVSGAHAQASRAQTSPVSPPAASSTPMAPASPPSSAASPSSPPPAVTPSDPAAAATPSGGSGPSSADASEADESGARYGGGYAWGPGRMRGYGPGMMGGYGGGRGGPGYGPGGGPGAGYGPGWGMGPPMMGGDGPGWGMAPGWGMGPGMMGGRGPGGGMGPGMMGGYGPGWGMGPGMMGGYGPGWGMAPGMMGGRHGWGMGIMGPGPALASLDLDDSQRKQLRELQQQQRRKHWELMGQMHEEMEKLQDAWGAESGTRDRAAILAASKRLGELRQQMLESQLDTADQLDRILTPEQHEQLRSRWNGGPGRGRR